MVLPSYDRTNDPRAVRRVALSPLLARARCTALIFSTLERRSECVCRRIMATCLRGGCRAPETQAPAESDAVTRLQQRQRALQSAIQRSAAPGRVADDYSFGHTLGALARLRGLRVAPWGYARANAPPSAVLRPALLPCLGPSARRAAGHSTVALGCGAATTRGTREESSAELLASARSTNPPTLPRGSLSCTPARGSQLNRRARASAQALAGTRS